MKPFRHFWILPALALAPCPLASALPSEWEPDYGQISQAGQEVIDYFAPAYFKERFEFASPEDLAAHFSPMQDALANQSIGTLAALQPRARQTLESLRANPNAQGYADWLEARMDYFDMAAEVERAIPSPPSPPPSPQPSPAQSKLPPHPTLSTPPLIPHPIEPQKKPLPPHPKTPQPTLIPHPATPPPPVASKPEPPPAAVPKPSATTPTVEKARNRYVESKQVWVRKLGARPVPARAAALLPDLKRIFREEGVPPEFVWQAEAESSFNPAARSPVGAAGLYQFMPATAQQFGLRLSPEDERLDALKNARAAAKYLKLLHGRFGNWPLAFAAYNCGQARVAGHLRSTGGSTFDDIHDKLPAETRMYVPKIAALVQIRERADIDRL